MNIVSVRKKQMGKMPKGSPQLYTCTVEFTEEELEALTDSMVVEVKPGALEDLTSFAISKWSKELTTGPWVTSPTPITITATSGSALYTSAT